MKNLWLYLLYMAGPIMAIGQEEVSWTFTAKKTAGNTYELRISAIMAESWCIYSKDTPEGGPLPTAIKFENHPMIIRNGSINEVGALQAKHEEIFDVDVLYYKDRVMFVQSVTLKKPIKTKVMGTVEFTACNDVQCLSPKTIPFIITLD
jgi:hypothetical protein